MAAHSLLLVTKLQGGQGWNERRWDKARPVGRKRAAGGSINSAPMPSFFNFSTALAIPAVWGA
jgi:hypothetical protein